MKQLFIRGSIIIGISFIFACNNEQSDPENSTNSTYQKKSKQIRPEQEMVEQEAYVTVGGAKLIPSRSIIDNASQAENLSSFIWLIETAELREELNIEGPFTLFAPTNEAFEALPEEMCENWKKPEYKDRLMHIVRNHVVNRRVNLSDLKNGGNIEMLSGRKLAVKLQDGNWMVNEGKIITPDVHSLNGTIHVVDKVFLP